MPVLRVGEYIPDVRERMAVSVIIDHYVCQLVGGHRDFNGKLYEFKLVESPPASARETMETSDNILYECPTHQVSRELLIGSIRNVGLSWPTLKECFIKTRIGWSALAKFARDSLTSKKGGTDEATQGCYLPGG